MDEGPRPQVPSHDAPDSNAPSICVDCYEREEKNDAPSSTGIAPRKGKVQCRKEKCFEQSYKTGKTYKHKGEEITKIPEEKYHKEAEAEAGTDHPFLGNDARYYFL